MRSLVILLGGLSICASLQAAAPAGLSDLRTAPLRFEPAASGDFAVRGPHYECRISPREVALRRAGRSARISFIGTTQTRLEPSGLLNSTTNVIRGNDPSQWRGIPNYSRIQARNLYPGIDIAYYGNPTELEYDLIVNPGAHPERIRFRYDSGRFHRGAIAGDFIKNQPVAYQLAADGSRISVRSRFKRMADGSYGFALGKYDPARRLIIDPAYTLGAYTGGTLGDSPVSVGVDSKGFVYVAGNTFSTDLPLSSDPYATTKPGDSDVFVIKLDPKAPAESRVLYSTYIGGAAADTLSRMIVKPDGTVVLAGTTASSDLPLGNAAQSSLKGTTDAFVVWLDPSQAGKSALYYGSYLGGTKNESGNDVAVDAQGLIYVTGTTNSTDFPLAGAYQQSPGGGTDAFAVMIDTGRSEAASLAYSTILGAGLGDQGTAVGAASDGTFWVAGTTYSSDFPTAGVYYHDYAGSGDAFIAHINPKVAGGSSLLYSTFFGGSDFDSPTRVLVDKNGRPVVAGRTLSKDLPVTSNALQPASAGGVDAFVMVLSPGEGTVNSSQLVYSTYFGGSDSEVLMDMTSDSAGNLYLAGFTLSFDLRTVNALQPAHTSVGGIDGFVVRMDPRRPGAAGLDYSSYVDSPGTQVSTSVAVDSAGTVYTAGYTSGSLFDPFGGPGKPSSRGTRDGYVLGFSIATPTAP